MWVISIPSRSARSSSGPRSSLPSISTPVPPVSVGDQVGVRQPLRVLGPLDDHVRLLWVAQLASWTRATRDGRCPRAGCGRPARGRPRSACGRRRAGRGSGRRRGGARASAGRPGGRARPRRSSPGRPPGSRRGRRGGCASPGWRRRSRWRRSSRGPARGPAAAGIRSGWAAKVASIASRGRRMRRAPRDQRAQPPAPGRGRRALRGPSGARQRPAGESAVTEAAQPARPISSADPGAEAVAGDVGALDAALLAAARDRGGEVAPRVGSTPSGSGGAVAEAGHVEDDHLALGAEQAERPAPRRASAAAEPVEEEQRRARRSRLDCHPGFAKRAWTSPIRRSRKPASEELR